MARPASYRIPVSQIGGMTTYREVDLRADGNDPLMQWLQAAADWEITDLTWNEKTDQPGEVTWRGGTLWDVSTAGEVTVECRTVHRSEGVTISAYVRAPFRPRFTGVVTVGGVEWRAFPVKPDELAAHVRGGRTSDGALQVADEGGPFRTASVPIAPTAQTILSTTCTGFIEQAFKDTIEAAIRRVYALLSKLNHNRGV